MNEELWYLRDALLVGLLVGASCGAVGVYVVLRRLAFVTDGVAHASLLGIALSAWASIPLFFGTLCFAALFAISLGTLKNAFRLHEDTATGILFSTCFALAVALLAALGTPSAELSSFLFGNILLVAGSEIGEIAFVVLLICAVLITFHRRLECFLVDEEFSREVGICPTRMLFLLNIVVAVTVVSATKVAGVILVTALVTIPASLALRWARSVRSAIVTSALLGIAITEIGIILSFMLDTPAGASIVLSAGVLFLVGNVASTFYNEVYGRTDGRMVQ